MADPWRLNAIEKGFMSLIPDDVRYFNDNFIGYTMNPKWKLPEYSVVGRSKRVPDFIGWHTAAPVVSERALSVLVEQCEEYFEALSFANIKGVQYFAINVTEVCDCIDFGSSEITFYGDESYGTPILINLISNVSTPNGMFKMKGIPGYVFVSDSLGDRLIDEGLTGFGLTKLSTDVLARVVRGQAPNDHPGISPRG